MECSVGKDILQDAISRVEKATGKQTQLAVLSCVLLLVEKNTLTLRATNLDIGVEIRIPVRGKKDGIVAVVGTTLTSLINTTQHNTLTLNVQDGVLTITTPNTKTDIKTVPYDDFPTLPYIETKEKITLPKDSLITGLQSVWYSASPSSMKPELSSVYVTHDNGTLTFTATDSFRLAEKKIVVKKKTGSFAPLLIPFKNIPDIIRNLELFDEQVTIVFNTNQIAFSDDGHYLTSRIIDGVFPDYGQIIPKESTTEVVILKQDIIHALKTAHIFSNTFNQVHFTIAAKKKQLQITTHNADVGESSVAVEGAITGEDVHIGFNYKYIMGCFQSIPQESVVLKLTGEGKPMTIQGVGDTTFLYLVMPMNR